ncbi:glycosyltransferase family 39 protein [Paenibacillus sp. GYB003]|uniref:glycosyltransferase family 39 protein n=1 Tax=Paenibacillus sp. GYB003 TaxID=2994392 RepID=UPI002F9684CC
MKAPATSGTPGRRAAWLIALLALVLLVRLPYLNAPPHGGYDSWRQSDTEAMARNLAEHRFHPLYPQLNYEGPPPNYAQLELQLTTGLIAALYRLFGCEYAFARIVPILFFMGSVWFVYRIGRMYFGDAAAYVALLLYGLLPLNVLYSRAIMPESAALFFYTGAFYMYSVWIAGGKRAVLYGSALFTALAVCEKVPTVFIGIAFIAMAAVSFGRRLFFRPELWAFAAIALLPPFVYYRWLGEVAEAAFVSGIAAKHILPDMARAFWTKEAAAFFVRELPKAFTWSGLVLSAIGFASLRRRAHYAVGVWAAAMLLELATIVAVIRFNYYLIFLGPPLALLAAYPLGELLRRTAQSRPVRGAAAGERRRGRPFAAPAVLAAAALVLVAAESFAAVAPVIGKRDAELLRQADIVRRLTGPDDLIVVGTDDPSLLNASRRFGWRVTNSVPGDPLAELRYFVREGAAYFVPLKGYIDGDPDGRLKRYLDAHYPKLGDDPAYAIYKLR